MNFTSRNKTGKNLLRVSILLPALAFSLQWSDADYGKFQPDSFAAGPGAARLDFSNIDYPLLHAAVFYETNRMRKQNGRKEFLSSPALEKAAKGHSDAMVSRGFFSHQSPVPGMAGMSDRLAKVGISNAYTGENIAVSFGLEYEGGRPVYTPDQNGGYFSYSFKGAAIEPHTYSGVARAVVKQWMNSPGHRANILNANYQYLGVGGSFYRDRNFHNMPNFKFTQNFASIRGPG